MKREVYEEEHNDDLLVNDIKETMLRNEDGPHISIMRDGIRVYTRDSQRPELSNNGGDYYFYTDYIVDSDGRVIALEDWSADWEFSEFFSTVIYVYGQHSVEELHAIAESLWS